jgi:hypothetical protein
LLRLNLLTFGWLSLRLLGTPNIQCLFGLIQRQVIEFRVGFGFFGLRASRKIDIGCRRCVC